MPSVECFLQQLRAEIPLTSQENRSPVQLVISVLVCSRQLDLDQDLPKLGRGQACADDRAMEVVAQLPNAPTLRQLCFTRNSLLEQARSRGRLDVHPQRRKPHMHAW
jgi:hypothetical protein